MIVCPNCGAANNEGSRFCINCGGALPEMQPVQPQEQQQQPVYQQPVYQQPVYQEPIYQQPIQPMYIQPETHPVQSEPAAQKNGFCTAGFVLSLLGIFLLGTTSLFGLIFSIVGLISSNKKNQSGKGKAVAGIVMSGLTIITAILVYIFSVSNAFGDYFDRATDSTRSTRSTRTTTEETVDDDSPDYEKMISKYNWITTGDGSYMVFNRKNKTFTYYMTYLDTSDNYYSGHYTIYYGKEAFNYITKDLSDLGITKDELRQIIRSNDMYDEDNLILICCDHEEKITGGTSQDAEPWTIHYCGFYLQSDQNGKTMDVLDLTNMEAASYITFIREDQYSDYIDNLPTNPTTDTSATYMTEQTEQTENTTSANENIVGDSISGTITLTQGTWDYWYEADDMDDFYTSRHQRINRDTATIFCVSVLAGSYDAGSAKTYAEYYKSNMESDGGFFNTTMEQTTMAGYTAYTVTGQYQDGMYLTIWYFVDKNNRLHYISVEYLGSDKASYEMVRDTYRLD